MDVIGWAITVLVRGADARLWWRWRSKRAKARDPATGTRSRQKRQALGALRETWRVKLFNCAQCTPVGSFKYETLCFGPRTAQFHYIKWIQIKGNIYSNIPSEAADRLHDFGKLNETKLEMSDWLAWIWRLKYMHVSSWVFWNEVNFWKNYIIICVSGSTSISS